VKRALFGRDMKVPAREGRGRLPRHGWMLMVLQKCQTPGDRIVVSFELEGKDLRQMSVVLQTRLAAPATAFQVHGLGIDLLYAVFIRYAPRSMVNRAPSSVTRRLELTSRLLQLATDMSAGGLREVCQGERAGGAYGDVTRGAALERQPRRLAPAALTPRRSAVLGAAEGGGRREQVPDSRGVLVGGVVTRATLPRRQMGIVKPLLRSGRGLA